MPDLRGTWKLIHFDVDVSSTIEYLALHPWATTAAYKTVTTENAGIYTIGDQLVTIRGLSFKADSGPLTITTVANGVRNTSQETPILWFVFPHDLIINYQRIGTDSLYFPGNGLLLMPDAQGFAIMQSQPSGARFSIDGNTLTIHTVVNRDTTFFYSGADNRVTEKDSGYVKLERQ